VNDYHPRVIEHFERPRNSGQWPTAPDVIQGHAGSVAQGVEFELSARIVGNTLQEVRFQAYGCPHCIASASWLTERLIGFTHAELLQWQWRELARVLEVPAEKYGRLLVLEDAVRGLAADWGRRL
jgi:NifU-like protein involved in Fe-S cluster formation